MRLRIGVNLLWLVPGVVGGSETYAVKLLDRLADRDDVDVTAFALPSFVEAYPELAVKMRTTTAPMSGGRQVVRRVGVENAWLPRKINAALLDVTHHLGGVIPPLCRGTSAVTVHDLQYLEYPQYFSEAKRRYLKASQGPSLKRADVVMAISDFTRRDILEHFDIDVSKVVVTPPVVSEAPHIGDADRHAVRESLGLQGDFVLYPAATYPHKNHLMLVRAFAAVAAEHDVTLVLTGATGAGAWGSAFSTQGEIAVLAEKLGVADKVRMLGYLPREQLLALYAEATMLAFPSRFEGFGLPVVEAMAAGCPVLAADATALPELVEGAGLLIDPDDEAEWTRQIARLLGKPTRRAELSAAGHKRATELALRDRTAPLVAGYRRAMGLA
jgi:glycosyltransferase involved in cell wall biosynthesis